MAYSFSRWLCRRGLATNQADRLLPMLAASGTVGMNRRQLGAAIDLEPAVLDDLLDGFVRFGVLTVSDDAEGRVYRIRPAASALALGTGNLMP